MKKVSIIIPAFNEEKYIKKTLQRVMRANCLNLEKEIIFVDDGSTDKTKELVKKYFQDNACEKVKLKLLKNKTNHGKGYSIKKGLKYSSADIIIIQDADTEYHPRDYPNLIKPIIQKKALVVYGSRTLGIKKYKNKYSSRIFYFGGRILTWYINFLFALSLTDQPTGYKIFKKQAVSKFVKKIIEDDFSFEIALTALIALNKIKIVEVPITYIPRSIKEGKKINLFDFLKALKVGLKYKSLFGKHIL